LLVAAFLCGCVAPPPVDPPPPDPTPEPADPWPGGEVGRIEEGPARPCAEPRAGWDRFREEGGSRGFDEVMASVADEAWAEGQGGTLAVADLDGDGDDDVLLARLAAPPRLFINDGAGHFTPGPVLGSPPVAVLRPSPYGLVDLTGDGRPDVVGSLQGTMVVWRSDDDWAEPEVWWEAPESLNVPALAFGHADEDATLDVVVVTSFGGAAEGRLEPDPVLATRSDGFEEIADLSTGPDGGASSQVALFTDRDGDSDIAVFTNIHARFSAWFRRESGPLWVSDADGIGGNLSVAGMGVDSADLNEDGALDYCVSDVGPPRCLLSDGDGGWLQPPPGGNGLTPVTPAYPDVATIGWSFDFADLDNDGFVDAVQASGPDQDYDDRGQNAFSDLLWAGLGGGEFEDVTSEAGFAEAGRSYGLATADFDGDGWLDVLVGGPDRPPELWMNTCGEAAWIEVELRGPPGNPAGFGARVEVVVGGRTQSRELYAVRATGQSAARLHFGLGDAEVVDELRVLWPGGGSTTARGLGVRAVVVAHSED